MLCGHARHGHGSSTGPASVDVVHATNFVAPPSRAPVVVTVHDLAFAHSPELCRPETLAYEPLLRQAIERGALGPHRERLRGRRSARLLRPAGRRGSRGSTRASPRPAMATRRRVDSSPAAPRYIVAMGTIEPRKNLPVLVRAFDVVAAAHDDALLVVAGPDGWGSQAFDDAVSRARFGERVRRLGYVTDAQRADLLAGASVLAYPSLYEGFGHPPFEAMAAGVPGRDHAGGRAARSGRRRRPPRRPHRRRRAGGRARPRARRSCAARAVLVSAWSRAGAGLPVGHRGRRVRRPLPTCHRLSDGITTAARAAAGPCRSR